MLENLFTILPDLVGTFAFAISGIKLASGKQVDWLGAYIIGLATAIGGGTIRDLLLGVTPFWMLDSRYFITTAVALLATLVFKEKLFRWSNTLFLFDTIGLGLVTIVGITKSVDANFPFWVCIVMGAITGSIGGVVYFVCLHFSLSTGLTEIIAASVVILVRVLAVQFHIHLPILRTIQSMKKESASK